MPAFWLKGGQLTDGRTPLELTDVQISEGKITALGRMPEGAEHQDITGCLLLPALTDLSAHLCSLNRVPQELQAAVAGGYAQVLLMPDTLPVLDNPATVAAYQERFLSAGGVRLLPVGALTRALQGQSLSNMAALRAAGCMAVSQWRAPMASPETLLRCLQYAVSQQLPVFFSPEEASLAQGCVHEGLMATRLGLPGIPGTAETVALATQLLLVAQTGSRAHFGQLSTAGSVQLIAWAKRQGLPITADVSVHQLLLTDAAIDGFNTLAHVRPPLRTEADRQALLQGVREGVIDAIASDHCPLDSSARRAPFAATLPGISAWDAALSLGYQLVLQQELTLQQLVHAMAVRPCQVVGQAAPALAVGAVADVLVFDPQQRWVLSAATMRSLGQNTPFIGQELTGKVRQLWLAGKVCG